MITHIKSIFLLTLLTLFTSAASAAPPNVLLICIDDLRPVLNSYGGAAITPNLDRFAKSATQFNNHYVQFPSCGPSRASMFSGLRPDTLNLYGNGGAWIVSKNPTTQPTMPRYFRDHGYTTLGFGKTYHGKGAGKGYGWSQTPWQPPSGWTCFVEHQYEGKGTVRPAYEIYDGPDSLHGDFQTATQAINALKQNRDRPFFIAAGFYKPHLPFVAPKKYWDLYNHDDIQPLKPLTIPQGAADHGYAFREITTYGYKKDGVEQYFTPDDLPTPAQTKDLTHAYYAAVSFNDAQVGRLLKALDDLGLADNTAVVIWSDHGFHLGDQARWAKWTQFEADMRSPLLIRLPNINQKSQPTPSTNALVEALDLYPTLTEYCNLPRPKHLEGQSLIPLITGQTQTHKPFALSQVTGLQSQKHMMAYSLRTPNFRYIQWRDTNQNNKLISQELYDLTTQSAETQNLATNPNYQTILKKHQQIAQENYASLKSSVAPSVK